MTIDEPVLAVDDIQGDVLAGFKKDHVRFVFFQLRADQIAAFKHWLANYSSQISSLRQVAGFNGLFKLMRRDLGREPVELNALWRNIAFTASGLQKLIGAAAAGELIDPAFQAGAEQLSATLGDPTDGSLGSTSTWLFGAGANVPDCLITLGADSADQLAQELGNLFNELTPFLLKGAHVEVGETRASLPGHEHFGFKDGVSQPAPRGKNPDGTYFIPRYLEPADPLSNYFAAPGQQLVWHGEFLLKGPKQKGSNSDALDSKASVDGPAWSTNGSYLVFRRLRQKVDTFNTMVDQVFTAMTADPGFLGTTRDKVAAMLVGRFESGCPIMRSDDDNANLGEDPNASNNFNFLTATQPMRLQVGVPVAPDTYTPAPADRYGLRCPFGAHIRKVNPRDESTDFGSGNNNLQRRILRRGIPYGPEFNPAAPDDEDRGLLFVCYQASIEHQFQKLVTDWINEEDAPKDPSGFDPLISTAKNRQFLAKRQDGTTLSIPLPDSIVVATGAAFLFVPPISALKSILTT